MENAVQEPGAAPAVPKDIDPKILAAYKQILTFQFLGTLVLATVLSVWLLVAHVRGWEVPVLVLVVLLGVLGASSAR